MAQMDYSSETEIVLMTDQVRVRHMHLKSGQSTSWHYHTQVVDNMYCLQGSLEVQAHDPDQIFLLALGQRCEILTGRVHRVVNAGQGPAAYLLVQGVGEYDFIVVDL